MDGGLRIQRFDPQDRLLDTRDADSGELLQSVSYDSAGCLAAVTDENGCQTHYERDGTGRISAIVAPPANGQRGHGLMLLLINEIIPLASLHALRDAGHV